MLRFGKITAVKPDKGLYQVTFDEDKLVSGWLFGAVPNSKDNKDECPFAKDEHVACMMDANMEYGVVFCAIYDSKNAPPNGEATTRSTKFKNGSSWKINTSNGHAELNLEKLTLNGGENGGIPKVHPLTEKVNIIENKINALLQLLAAWTPVSNDGGAALKSAFSALVTTTLAQITNTVVADLENTDIIH